MLSFYLIVCGIVSYFIGNVNWAIIISKRNHKDIRNMGSGNPGALIWGAISGLNSGL